MATIYYGKGDKNAIMASIATKIRNISGVNFVDYQRAYDTGISPEKFPGAFVNDITEEKKQMLKDVCKNTFTVGIVGWVRAGYILDIHGVETTVEENLWEKMNTFVNAIKSAIEADASHSNNAYNTVISRVRTDAGSRHPVGLFAMVVTVVYFTSY